MNQIINRNGQLSSCVGEAATSAFAIRTLIGAIQLKQKGIQINSRMTGRMLLQRATSWTGKPYKRGAYDAALEDLKLAMNAKVAECEVVNE